MSYCINLMSNACAIFLITDKVSWTETFNFMLSIVYAMTANKLVILFEPFSNERLLHQGGYSPPQPQMYSFFNIKTSSSPPLKLRLTMKLTTKIHQKR